MYQIPCIPNKFNSIQLNKNKLNSIRFNLYEYKLCHFFNDFITVVQVNAMHRISISALLDSGTITLY